MSAYDDTIELEDLDDGEFDSLPVTASQKNWPNKVYKFRQPRGKEKLNHTPKSAHKKF